jgi:hypothetical protein
MIPSLLVVETAHSKRVEVLRLSDPALLAQSRRKDNRRVRDKLVDDNL